MHLSRVVVDDETVARNFSVGSNQGILTEGEGISTVDLLVLASSDQLLLIMKLLSFFFTKQPIFNEEVNCTEPFPLS